MIGIVLVVAVMILTIMALALLMFDVYMSGHPTSNRKISKNRTEVNEIRDDPVPKIKPNKYPLEIGDKIRFTGPVTGGRGYNSGEPMFGGLIPYEGKVLTITEYNQNFLSFSGVGKIDKCHFHKEWKAWQYAWEHVK